MTDTATILVVDDQPQNLRLLDAILSPVAMTAHSGFRRRGVGDDRGGEVDLVLLDIVMPEMNGYEVCRRVRSRLTRSTSRS